MDFISAEEFLDHLERHPNGAFVLVKRDLPQPTPAPSETQESEEPSEHSPILPETLRNQIKVSREKLSFYPPQSQLVNVSD